MSFVTTEIQGAVAIVTIDRPKALNALNPEVLADLKAAFEAIDQNTVRCVVLTLSLIHICVASIALIFFVRKFLFVPAFGATMPGGRKAPDIEEMEKQDTAGESEK